MEHQTGHLADAKHAHLAGWSRQHKPVKGIGDATDQGHDQAPPAPHDTGRAAHPQQQDSAAMVFRITAAGDTRIRPLTREDMPNELDPLGDRQPVRAGASGQRPVRVLQVEATARSKVAVAWSTSPASPCVLAVMRASPLRSGGFNHHPLGVMA